MEENSKFIWNFIRNEVTNAIYLSSRYGWDLALTSSMTESTTLRNRSSFIRFSSSMIPSKTEPELH